MVYVKRLYVSDTSQAVHGLIAASPSGVDDDDEFGWEVHLRAVCLSGFPRRPWGDTGARCGKMKSHGDENLLCTLMDHHTAKGQSAPVSRQCPECELGRNLERPGTRIRTMELKAWILMM